MQNKEPFGDRITSFQQAEQLLIEVTGHRYQHEDNWILRTIAEKSTYKVPAELLKIAFKARIGYGDRDGDNTGFDSELQRIHGIYFRLIQCYAIELALKQTRANMQSNAINNILKYTGPDYDILKVYDVDIRLSHLFLNIPSTPNILVNDVDPRDLPTDEQGQLMFLSWYLRPSHYGPASLMTQTGVRDYLAKLQKVEWANRNHDLISLLAGIVGAYEYNYGTAKKPKTFNECRGVNSELNDYLEVEPDTAWRGLLGASTQSTMSSSYEQALQHIFKMKKHPTVRDVFEELNSLLPTLSAEAEVPFDHVKINPNASEYQEIFGGKNSLNLLNKVYDDSQWVNEAQEQYLEVCTPHDITVTGPKDSGRNSTVAPKLYNRSSLVRSTADPKSPRVLTTDLELNKLFTNLPKDFPRIFISEEHQDANELLTALSLQNCHTVDIYDVQADPSQWIDAICRDKTKKPSQPGSGFFKHETNNNSQISYHSALRVKPGLNESIPQLIDTNNGIITDSSLTEIIGELNQSIQSSTRPNAIVVKCIEGKDRSPFIAWMLTLAFLYRDYGIMLNETDMRLLSHHFRYQVGTACEMKYVDQLIDKFGSLQEFATKFYPRLKTPDLKLIQATALTAAESKQNLDNLRHLFGMYCHLEYQKYKSKEHLLLGLTIALAILGIIGGLICAYLAYKHKQTQTVMMATVDRQTATEIQKSNRPIGIVNNPSPDTRIYTFFDKSKKLELEVGDHVAVKREIVCR